jgi:hypothetical protein
MPFRPRWCFRFPGLWPGVLLIGLVCWADRPVHSQSGALVLPIRVVNGHIFVLTDFQGLRYTNEASFEISFEYPDTLTLHPDQYNWVGINPNDLGLGEPARVHVRIEPGIDLAIPVKELAIEQSSERLEFQNMMTRLHASGLGERKVKGTIGVGLLRKYHVTLDVHDQQLILAPPREPGEPVAAAELADLVIRPFEYVNNRIRVPMRYGDDAAGRMVLGGSNYDTLVDSRVAARLSKPAGDIGPVWLADSVAPGEKRVDLSRYMAFRPKPFGLTPTPSADSPTIIAGVNFLEHFRVELDWNNQTLALTQKKAPSYPQADFEFFKAETSGSSAALRAYLEQYPDARLSREAASLLVTWLVEKDRAPDADVLEAVTRAVQMSMTGRRTETALSYLGQFAETPERANLAIEVGKMGLEHSREAFDARVVYAMHNALGQLYFKKDDVTSAWRHFLSAAFMAPEDMSIVLNLARVYDKQGQVRRAYARYKRVAGSAGLPPDVSAEVKAAMDRLRPQLPKDDPLLIEDAPRPPAGVPPRPGGRGGGGGESSP